MVQWCQSPFSSVHLKNDIDNDAPDHVVFADVTLWKTDKVRQIDDRRQLVNLKIPSIPQEFTHSPREREKKREREIQLNPLYPVSSLSCQSIYSVMSSSTNWTNLWSWRIWRAFGRHGFSPWPNGIAMHNPFSFDRLRCACRRIFTGSLSNDRENGVKQLSS